MLPSIDFDRQLRLSTRQVDDERLDHQLAREPWSVMSQPKPQNPFRFGGRIAQLAGVLREFRIDALH
jgi:hypothetical protein